MDGNPAKPENVKLVCDKLKETSKTKLLIIGSGQLETELKNQVKILKLEKSVLFLGAIKHDDLPPYFATADIFVSPSLEEGFGITFVEATASGCFSIGTNVGGIKEIIPKDDIDGELKIVQQTNATKDTLAIFQKDFPLVVEGKDE
ncbi:MAG: glycosyltransferase [Pseudomonadota bacterium]